MYRLKFIIFFAFGGSIFAENCDKYGICLYEDLACKPSISNNNPCPTSYDCKLQPPKSNQCVVRGNVFKTGDAIPTTQDSFACESGCSCNLPQVTCPQWGCGHWAGQPPVPSGCRREFTLEVCCSTGIICPPFNDTTTCTVDGVKYYAGQRFYPKDSCHVCLCQKGFSGKFEKPYCKRIGCDAQVKNQDEIQKFCSPVYIKKDDDENNKCCPRVWTCPDGTEIIKTSGKQSNLVCKYGDKELQVGDTFEKEITYASRPKKIKCECKIPPLLICEEA